MELLILAIAIVLSAIGGYAFAKYLTDPVVKSLSEDVDRAVELGRKESERASALSKHLDETICRLSVSESGLASLRTLFGELKTEADALRLMFDAERARADQLHEEFVRAYVAFRKAFSFKSSDSKADRERRMEKVVGAYSTIVNCHERLFGNKPVASENE